MFNEIIHPSTNEYVLRLPDELVDSDVRVTADKVPEPVMNAPITEQELEARVKALKQRLENSGILFSHIPWKFNRDEATNYD